MLEMFSDLFIQGIIRETQVKSHTKCSSWTPVSGVQGQIRESVKFQEHVKIHREKGQEHSCLICWKKFESEATLKNHVKSHDRRFPCHICQRSFTSNSFLQMHMAQHAGLKLPWRCLVDQCTEEYSDVEVLQRHVLCAHLSNYDSQK